MTLNNPVAIKNELKSLSETPHHFATVLPLDYEPGRTEHAVLFFSSDWSDLAKLLKDPYEFVLGLQEEFSEEQGSLKWMIRRPVTAIVRPGESRERSIVTMQSFAVHAYATQNGMDVAEVSENLPHSFDDLLDAVTAKGGFYAEFAICTSVLTVYYWPPSGEDALDLFTGELTRGVLGYIPGPKRVGTLHFDLADKYKENPEKPMTQHRADFIVECIQRKQLDQRLKEITIEVGNTSLFAPGENVQVPSKPQAMADDPADPISFTQTLDRLPTIYVERLSELPSPAMDPMMTMATDGEDCTACCNAQVHEDPSHPGTFLIGDVVVKCYSPCPPGE